MDSFDEKLYDKIEDYLRGRLSAEETTRFEGEVAASPALQEQVNLHRLEWEARERMIREQIREQVREWGKNQAHPREKRHRRKWLWLLLLLGVVAGGLVIWWRPVSSGGVGEAQKPAPSLQMPPDTSHGSPQPIEQEKVPEESQPPKPKSKVPVASNEQIRQERLACLDRDLAEWDKRGLEEIQRILNQYGGLEPKDEAYEESRLELGRAYLHTGKNAESAEIFRYILRKYPPDSRIFKRAQWYLSLALLNEYPSNRAEILALLRQIAKPDSHPYRGDAIRLLSLLDGGF